MAINEDESQDPMPDGVLGSLGLTPAEVSGLPSKARTALLSYLRRWQHYEEARLCLEQLVVTHAHLVSMYDALAQVYLTLGQPERALSVMARRHVLRISSSSRLLEARAQQAGGDSAAAMATVQQVLAEQPAMLSALDLQAELCWASGDWESAERVLDQREALQPETVGTALGLARLWQARGDAEKALLWARTALSRTERDERQPSPQLLLLLENLYHVTGQSAQAEATAQRRRQREEQELDELRRAVGLALPSAPQPRDVAQTAEPTPLPAPPDLSTEERARMQDALQHHFPHADFRPGQAEIIAAVLRGESVLAVMPTGAGKSLCYQLAALLLPGTTLVISPLIALMKDQLDGLPDGVAAQATTINSTLDGTELDSRLARAAGGSFRLVYAAPERLRQQPFLHALKQAGISLMVVDEAHCVSMWGHDFRPDYRFIAKAWEELGSPRILAMTATATPRVRDDIQAALGHMRVIATDVHRPNLRLEARLFANEAEKKRALVSLCRQIEGSGIVYANSRLKCEELAEMLRKRGVSAIHYHAGIGDRAEAQDRFMSGKARVVVATVAFGMGVDKAEVRFIIHFHPPRALENYYQEAGRAGRDGLPARCILFHASSDKANLTRWNRQDALQLEFLRRLYSAVQRRLGRQEVGLVNAADLQRDLDADDTQVRVGIHFLEGAGLVWRGFDLARTASLTLSNGRPDTRAHTDWVSRAQDTQPTPSNNGAFARFVEAARLVPGQTVSRDLVVLSRDGGFDLREIEAQLLAWDAAGWLNYRGIGRDMLLALTQPPSDSRERVAAMLADYRAGQDSRVAEIVAYAETQLCRHGYISAYFGGRPIQHCASCDNCAGTQGHGRLGARLPASMSQPATASAEPQVAARHAGTKQVARPAAASGSARNSTGLDPRHIVLQAVDQLPFPLGRTGLSRVLQGARSSPIQPDRFPLFGALSHLTQDRIRELADHMIETGYLELYRKGRYQLLQLTDPGRAYLDARREGRAAARPAPQSEPSPPKEGSELMQRLCEWRLATAREIGRPAFVIFPNATLQRVAAARPTNLKELAAIKGVGPEKLEKYGQAVLKVISEAGQNGDS